MTSLLEYITMNICVILYEKCIKGGRCAAFNYIYENNIADEVFSISSAELDIKSNVVTF